MVILLFSVGIIKYVAVLLYHLFHNMMTYEYTSEKIGSTPSICYSTACTMIEKGEARLLDGIIFLLIISFLPVNAWLLI